MPPATRRTAARPPKVGSRGASARARIPADPAARARRAERQRRERHLRRLRRDLLEDVAMAIGLMIVILSVTAGLGVVALLEIPVGAAVLASFLVERRIRRRS
jgi:hypothetical protein